MINNQIICAIDNINVNYAKELILEIKPYVAMVKLGLEFFCANGPVGVKEISKMNVPIFLDLKLHDIPNTVSKALKSMIPLQVSLLTIHSLGGANMMKGAIKLVKEEAALHNIKAPMLVAVTILTSMDEADLESIGIDSCTSDAALKLASLAQNAGLDGIVCSPHEIALIKKKCGVNFKTVVPGIRPALDSINDQKRVLTPMEAIKKGADYLVIGRPITEAPNPKEAARKIAFGYE